MNAMQRLQASVARHWDTLGAEPTEYRAGTDAPVRPASGGIWGTTQWSDGGYGVPVQQRSVWVRAAELVNGFGDVVVPKEGGRLVRNPDGWRDGSEELWAVLPAGITRDGDVWELRVQRGAP